MFMKKILMILFVAIAFNVNGQTVANPQSDTLRWNASGFTDQLSSVTAQTTIQFVTYGSSKIDFIQKGGKLVYTFSVNSVSGAWTDASADGSLVYNISFNDLTGTLTVTRASGAISITLNVTNTTDKINNQYAITNFDIL